MKNKIFFKAKSKMKLNIKGKNIERFIKRIITNHIEILKVEPVNRTEINLVIYKDDYAKILELKTIYNVTLIDVYGIIKIREVINIYKFIIGGCILGICLLVFLSNIIFNIEVIHTDSEVRKFLTTELENYGLKQYRFKKSFHDIQSIKKQILETYKDKIEWLEIEESGTTYIVKLQLRILPDTQKDNRNQHIIATKNAVLKKVTAENGQIIKETNSYVNTGDIVISSDVYLNGELKNRVRAEGTIYGEVWYKVSVEYPYIYSEVKETGKYKEAYSLKILNKEIEFSFDKYKEKRVEEKTIIKHSLLPFSFVKQSQREIETISLVLTEEEAIAKAIEEAKKKMNDQLKDDETIIKYQILQTNVKEDKVVLDIFFTVYENITGYQVVEEGEGDVS